jgi:hypothetical protein
VAEHEIKVTIGAKDEASKKIKAVDKELAALLKQKATIEVDLSTDDARKQLADVTEQIEKLQGEKAEIVIDANVNKALAALDDVAVEAKKAEAAAEALSAALGPELAGKADLDGIISDFQRMDLSLDDITANADRLGAKLRDVAATDPGGNLDNALGRARRGVDDVGRSADSSKSALANMIGNSAQDLGALGGLAGSAGVAFGQMGEYIADAALDGERLGSVIASFAKIVGPIAALTAVFQTVTGMQQSSAESAELAKISVEGWTEALKDSGDTAANMSRTLDEQGRIVLDNARNFGTATKILTNIPVIGWFGEKDTEDITRLFDAAAIGAGVYTEAVVDQGVAEENLKEAIDQSNLSEDEKGKLLRKLKDDIEDYNKAAENRIRNEKIFASTVGSTNSLLQQELQRRNPLEFYRDQWNTLMTDIRDGTVDTKAAAEAVDLLADKLGINPQEVISLAMGEITRASDEATESLDKTADGLQDWADRTVQAFADANEAAVDLADAQQAIDDMASGFGTMTRKAEAMEEAFALGNAPIEAFEAILDINEAIRDLGEFIRDEGVPNIFDPNAVDAQPFLQKIASLRQPVQQAIVAAFATGGPAKAQATADAYVKQIVESMRGKLSEAQVRTLLSVPERLTTTLEVGVDQESLKRAEQLLEVFTGLRGETPWTAAVELAVASGELSPDAANVLIARELEAVGVDVPANLIAPDEASKAAALKEANDWAALPGHQVGMQADVNDPSIRSLLDARNAGQKQADGMPIVFPSTVALPRTSGGAGGRVFFSDAGGIIPSGGVGIVAERRPEIINSRFLVTDPTVVPSGTRVTSGARTARILRTRGTRGLRRYDAGGVVAGGPSTVNVHFNGVGAIGNRFDLMRMVERARLDKIRLYGTRG